MTSKDTNELPQTRKIIRESVIGKGGQEEFYKCNCDCGCLKNNDRKNDQCDDCDNDTHYDDINKVYVNYDDERHDC